MQPMMFKLPVAIVAAATVGNVAMSASADYVEYVTGHEQLIAHFRLDEVPGENETAVDASGNGHGGTFNGNVTSTEGAEALGSDNRAVALNGEGMIPIDNDPVDREQLTFVCFFRSTDATAEGQRIYTTAKDARHQFSIFIHEGKLRVAVEAPGVHGSGTTTDLSADSHLDGAWHHLVVSRGGNQWGDVQIWIDFEPVDTEEGGWAGKGTLEEQAVIGARSTHPANAFHGALDEVSFFEGPFDQAEVDRLKEALPADAS